MAKPWHRWPAGLRASILQRDNWLCQIKGPHCTTRATEVDHITTPHQGGEWFDPHNLRSACAHCNRSRGGADGRSRTRPARYVGPSREW
jgi:5-methylcytosine-specific restriction endonuclease McrA